MRTPRDSTYARVAAGDYDADWEEHYAPPPPPNLKRAAQAPKKIATVGAAGRKNILNKVQRTDNKGQSPAK
jgi:hypothetical protein